MSLTSFLRLVSMKLMNFYSRQFRSLQEVVRQNANIPDVARALIEGPVPGEPNKQQHHPEEGLR